MKEGQITISKKKIKKFIEKDTQNKVIKPATEAMQESWDNYNYLSAYAEACKSRKIIRLKTIAKAIMAKNESWNNFCEIVHNHYPEYKDATYYSILNNELIIQWK